MQTFKINDLLHYRLFNNFLAVDCFFFSFYDSNFTFNNNFDFIVIFILRIKMIKIGIIGMKVCYEQSVLVFDILLITFFVI